VQPLAKKIKTKRITGKSGLLTIIPPYLLKAKPYLYSIILNKKRQGEIFLALVPGHCLPAGSLPLAFN
jgi:hypothetical protein